MERTFAYTPDIWLPFVMASILISLLFYSWSHRDVPGATLFAVGCLFTALWMVSLIIGDTVVDAAARIFWFKIQNIWQLPAATTVTCFILEYTWPGRFISRRNLILLSIIPLLFLGMLLTNDFHRLLWIAYLNGESISAVPGQAVWFFLAYSYGLLIINFIVLGYLFLHSPQHRWPVVIMAIGQLVGRVAFTLDTFLLTQTNLPIDILGMGFLFLMYAIVLYGFHLFDPIVLARQKAIDRMRAGMLVLDNQGRITSVNPTTPEMLRVPAGSLKGRFASELLPAYANAQTTDPGVTEMQFSLRAGSEDRSYTLDISALKDWRGQEVGRLLMLRDVTERKQAEAALRESEQIRYLIFENASDGIAIYEEYPERGERRILECNERYAQMSGRSREELLKIGDTARIQKSLPLVPYAKPRMEIGEAQSEGVFSWMRPDGKENIIEYSAASFRVGGRLLTIGLDRDVTERKQVEARMLEQERALAIHQEREQLARELHDNLAQVFAFISTQGQAIRHLLRRGDLQLAETYVSQMVDAAMAANVDIRESILSLRMALSEHGLSSTIAQYLAFYEKNYHIHTEFVEPDARYNKVFEPMVEVQLLRILQESLTNVRKHAHARSVRITFAWEDHWVRVTVQDDGQGFDTSLPTDGSDEHVGLRMMHERAEESGGSLQVHSEPGQGTRVEVRVPIRPYTV